MKDADVARMVVEGLAFQLSALPDTIWAHARAGGCSSAIVDGVRAAREAFHEHASENDIAMLADQVEADVREGLRSLDQK